MSIIVQAELMWWTMGIELYLIQCGNKTRVSPGLIGLPANPVAMLSSGSLGYFRGFFGLTQEVWECFNAPSSPQPSSPAKMPGEEGALQSGSV
jgi:hypothetical protein